MTSVAFSKLKKLFSRSRTKSTEKVPKDKPQEGPAEDDVSHKKADTHEPPDNPSRLSAIGRALTTPRKTPFLSHGQESSVSPKSKHHKPPDAIIFSHGSIVPTSDDGYAMARLCSETYVQPPRIKSSHGDIRRIVPLDLNKSLPAIPESEETAEGQVPNSRAWIEKAFEVSAELEKRRLSGVPVVCHFGGIDVEGDVDEQPVIAARLSILEERVLELEKRGGSP